MSEALQLTSGWPQLQLDMFKSKVDNPLVQHLVQRWTVESVNFVAAFEVQVDHLQMVSKMKK